MEWLEKMNDALDYIEVNLQGKTTTKHYQKLLIVHHITFNVRLLLLLI